MDYNNYYKVVQWTEVGEFISFGSFAESLEGALKVCYRIGEWVRSSVGKLFVYTQIGAGMSLMDSWNKRGVLFTASVQGIDRIVSRLDLFFSEAHTLKEISQWWESASYKKRACYKQGIFAVGDSVRVADSVRLDSPIAILGSLDLCSHHIGISNEKDRHSAQVLRIVEPVRGGNPSMLCLACQKRLWGSWRTNRNPNALALLGIC